LLEKGSEYMLMFWRYKGKGLVINGLKGIVEKLLGLIQFGNVIIE
jgi:hypothetical protein